MTFEDHGGTDLAYEASYLRAELALARRLGLDKDPRAQSLLKQVESTAGVLCKLRLKAEAREHYEAEAAKAVQS